MTVEIAYAETPPRPADIPPDPLTERPLWWTFLIFVGPMMLSNILQALSGTLNNVYLGQMIGVKALAAATVFFPLMFFFMSFSMGLGSGASVLIGQAWGAKNFEKVRTIAGSALGVGLVGATLIAVLGGLFAGHLMAALGAPADILEGATAYARIMLISMPLLFMFILATSMLRGVGDTVTPLLTLAISGAVGLAVTPALIAGWFGLPRLGVASAAVASTCGLVVAMSWMCWRLRRTNHPLAPNAAMIRAMRPNWAILRPVLRIGLPTALQMVVMSLTEMVLLGMVTRFGSDAVAAYGAVNQVLAYVQFPAMSIAMAASVLGAQAIGAGRPDRLWPITQTGLVLNALITGSGVVLIYLLARPVIGLFINDPQVVDVTLGLLRIVLWSTVVFGMAGVFSGIMRASGTVIVPTALSIFAVLAVEAPAAWFFSHKIGLSGVWIAYPLAFTTMFILQGSYYGLVWRRRPIAKLI